MTEAEVRMLGIDPESPAGRSMTAPSGGEFRRSLKRLPLEWAKTEDQLHVQLPLDTPTQDVGLAWSNLAVACHVRHREARGYIDHDVVIGPGERVRCIRVILKPEEVH